MKGLEFPIYKSKTNTGKAYNLAEPKERKEYFQEKVGKELDDLREYMKNNTFIAYLLGKKQAGKGTYSKLFAEALGEDLFLHFSVGDIVRNVDKVKNDKKAKDDLFNYLEKNYRGFISLEKAFETFLKRDTKTLLPTEFILALVKREIDIAGKTSLFIDGFPRKMDQITYALYFRELINYRNDPDLFILFDVAEEIINERIKFRRICPKCSLSRNLKLFPTSKIEYEESDSSFHLLCDNSKCSGGRLISKEGDELGIEAIRERINIDDELIRKAFDLHGVPKILLRNNIPVKVAEELVNDYEITPAFNYKWKDGKIEIIEDEWTFVDDNEIESYSLMAAAVTVSMIKQLHELLVGGK